MTYVTISEARAAAPGGIYLSESELRHAAKTPAHETFDIFLSHALPDAEVIQGVKTLLQREGLSVYVDWIADPQADRTDVSPATADLLRNRMNRSRFLVYASSLASPNSKWMPWELGYFDGRHPGKVGILPIIASAGTTFQGQEYLGLYPPIEQISFTGLGRRLGRHTTPGNGDTLRQWVGA